MNVVIYARYSSHNQTEQSIEGQLKVCYEYAKQHNLTVVNEYIDRAMTGTNDNREQFQKMIEDSDKKRFQGVLVYQLDRFGRGDIKDAINENKLNENGVTVISAKENFTDDPSGNLLKGVIRSVNKYYSDELSVKVRRGMDINGDKHFYNGGNVPLGLKLEIVEEQNGPFNKKIYKKKFVIDEETAPIVHKIFEMYVNDNTMADIIRYLNKKGIKTSQGNEFNKNSIRTIILNKKYIGIYSYKGKETKGVIPSIVEEELFYKAQNKLLNNKKAPARKRAKTQYLLTTKLFCGNCKEMMVGVSGTSRNGKLHCYYSCKGNWQKKCARKNIGKDYIEDLVVDLAREILTDENINIIAKEIVEYSKKQKSKSNLKALQKQLKLKEKERANLLDSLKKCKVDIVKQTIFEEIQKEEEERIEIQKQIMEEEQAYIQMTIPQIKAFLKLIRNGSENDIRYRQMLVDVLIYRIYIYDSDLTIMFNVGNKETRAKLPDIEEIECSFNGNDAQPNYFMKKRIYILKINFN